MSVSSVGMYLASNPLRTALVGTSLLALAAVIGTLAYRIISKAAERVEKEKENRLQKIQNGSDNLKEKMSIQLTGFSALQVSELFSQQDDNPILTFPQISFKDEILAITKALKNIDVEVDRWVDESIPSLASDIKFEEIYDKFVKDKYKSLGDNDGTYENLKFQLEYTENSLAYQTIDLKVMKETYFNYLTDVREVIEIIKNKLETANQMGIIGYIRALIRHI